MEVTVTLLLSTRMWLFAHFLVVRVWDSPLARPLANGAGAAAAAGPAVTHWAQQVSWVQLGEKKTYSLTAHKTIVTWSRKLFPKPRSILDD